MQMYMWTGPSEETVPIKLNNCDEYCSIEDYLSLVSIGFPSDDDMRCLYKNLKPTDLEKYFVTDSQNISL